MLITPVSTAQSVKGLLSTGPTLSSFKCTGSYTLCLFSGASQGIKTIVTRVPTILPFVKHTPAKYREGGGRKFAECSKGIMCAEVLANRPNLANCSIDIVSMDPISSLFRCSVLWEKKGCLQSEGKCILLSSIRVLVL